MQSLELKDQPRAPLFNTANEFELTSESQLFWKIHVGFMRVRRHFAYVFRLYSSEISRCSAGSTQVTVKMARKRNVFGSFLQFYESERVIRLLQRSRAPQFKNKCWDSQRKYCTNLLGIANSLLQSTYWVSS